MDLSFSFEKLGSVLNMASTPGRVRDSALHVLSIQRGEQQRPLAPLLLVQTSHHGVRPVAALTHKHSHGRGAQKEFRDHIIPSP